MRWFSKVKQKEAWEYDEVGGPAGDIQTAHKVRDICGSVASSAEKLARLANRPNDTIKKAETARYEAARQRALELAKQVSDELLRDTALRQIVNLCMSAGDVETATAVIDLIQTKKVWDEVVNEHPSLR